MNSDVYTSNNNPDIPDCLFFTPTGRTQALCKVSTPTSTSGVISYGLKHVLSIVTAWHLPTHIWVPPILGWWEYSIKQNRQSPAFPVLLQLPLPSAECLLLAKLLELPSMIMATSGPRLQSPAAPILPSILAVLECGVMLSADVATLPETLLKKFISHLFWSLSPWRLKSFFWSPRDLKGILKP